MILFHILGFLFDTLPRIAAWLCLLVAVFFVVVCVKAITRKAEQSFIKWIVLILSSGYALTFLITRIFFAEIWSAVFPGVGLLSISISYIWSRYEDKRNGIRWWNW